MGSISQVSACRSVGCQLEPGGTGQGSHANPAEGRFACALAGGSGGELRRADFEKLSETKISPFDLWSGSIAKGLLRQGWIDYVAGFAEWKHMITLTFAFPISEIKALAIWSALVKKLGKRYLGKNYSRRYGHSYFSYCIGLEYQDRGVVHFHVLVDQWVDYSYIHKLWNKWAGWAWIDQVKSHQGVVVYITKYVLKSGVVDVYRPNKKFISPEKIWIEKED